jgi:hypothetical protein
VLTPSQSRLLQQRTRLQVKLPELKKALDMVTLLLEKQARRARRPAGLASQLHERRARARR